MSAERIAIFDTTLRDGEQSPGCSMNLKEKLLMARQLETLGVDVIEAGFPIASEGDFAAVNVPSFDERSNSGSPSSASRRRMAWLTAGCVRCNVSAAREKLFSRATAANTSS